MNDDDHRFLLELGAAEIEMQAHLIAVLEEWNEAVAERERLGGGWTDYELELIRQLDALSAFAVVAWWKPDFPKRRFIQGDNEPEQ